MRLECIMRFQQTHETSCCGVSDLISELVQNACSLKYVCVCATTTYRLFYWSRQVYLFSVGNQCFLFGEISVGSPQKYISLPNKTFSGAKYPKNILINFEKGSTVGNVVADDVLRHVEHCRRVAPDRRHPFFFRKNSCSYLNATSSHDRSF